MSLERNADENELHVNAKKQRHLIAHCIIPNVDEYDEFQQFEYQGEYYYVARSGKVYVEARTEDEFAFNRVKDKGIVAAICKMMEEDSFSDHVRDALAETLSSGDSLLRQVLRIHIEYNGGQVSSYPFVKEGIRLYRVGRNASHEFYLGVKDGKMYRYSFGEESYDCVSGETSYAGDGPTEVDPERIGYIGHF